MVRSKLPGSFPGFTARITLFTRLFKFVAMTKLNIKLLAYRGASDAVFENGISRLEKLISPESFTLTDTHPDVLFFLTGGSEQAAVECIAPGQFYLLIGSPDDNSYASATEVKAYLDGNGIAALLLGENSVETQKNIADLLAAKQAIHALKGKKLGLIGAVSDWLVSSSIPAGLLHSKLGIDLQPIPWSELAGFSDYEASTSFLDTFSATPQIDLSETAKVDSLLAHTVQQRALDAITVECFPMVQKHGVTACLPLARFNNEGIPAGCEGDLTAIAGMMLGKELTGTVPWIANINKVSNEGCLFSHCTIAPGLVTDYTVTTHFETGKGTAIAGYFKEDIVTVFRLNRTLNKAFIATGTVIGRPASAHACRTQIEVKLAEKAVKLLVESPLGNHHLIFPGNCINQLLYACMMLGIEVLK